MKIVVPVKRTVDPNVKVRISQDGHSMDTRSLKMGMNPFCEIAVEEAIRLKEAGKASTVIVVTVGAAACEDILRHGLGMGADRAILIETELSLQPLAIAKLLKVLVDKEQPDLIISGKQSVDEDNNQTGQMLAALLGWPQGTFASKIELEPNRAIITREVDDGLERLALTLPAVVTTDLRLNQPRYLKLPNIMKAKKMPVERLLASESGIDLRSRLVVQQLAEPAKRGGCIKVQSVAELVNALHNVARVI